MSIIEKALEKLEGSDPPRPVAPPDPVVRSGAMPQPELSARDLADTDALVTRVQARGPARPKTPPAVPTLKPEARPASASRLVELDLVRLARGGFLTPQQAQSRLAEEYRHLKRPLLRRAEEGEEDSNLIIITSSLPGEGKTYMAINLAMSMAMEVDRTVLLVDADVAKADVSRVLEVHDAAGLSSYLSGSETDLSKLILRTNVDSLAILPSGPHFAKLTELLASAQMTALVKELSDRYPDRIVLFDSPPLLATSGASVLSHLMGQVLMVVEAVRTPKSAVKAALRQLAGVRNLNFVLNKQRRSLTTGFGGYDYSYGYGYGYGYGTRPTEG